MSKITGKMCPNSSLFKNSEVQSDSTKFRHTPNIPPGLEKKI